MSGEGRHIKKGTTTLFGTAKSRGVGKRAKRTVRQTLLLILKAFLALVFCFLMITPLRSCEFGEKGYIGADAAQTIAVSSAGVAAGIADNVKTDFISIDGRRCYKVDFVDFGHSYSYIIDASNGSVIATRVDELP